MSPGGSTADAADQVVVVGGSAGAIEAAVELAAGLPPGLPAAVCVVIHFPESATSMLPAILGRAGPLPVDHAVNGGTLVPGHIYVAPPGRHLLLNHGEMVLSRGPKENGHRPAIDPLFRTAARAYRARATGVLLSGGLDDGTAGLRRLAAYGGRVVVQDPATAVHRAMIDNALAAVRPDHTAAPAKLGPLLARLAREAAQEAPMEPDQVASGAHADYLADPHAAEPSGPPSGLTCPECHGALWEVSDGASTRYQCRVGHAFGVESLLAEHSDSLEAALWTALRALEEHAALSHRLAGRAEQRSSPTVAESFRRRAADSEAHASVVREVLNAMPATPGLPRGGVA
jgi:two-component system chemotaxis response regulator CheB